MNKQLLISFAALFFSSTVLAQRDLPGDTLIKTNESVTVYAFAQKTVLLNTPASVGTLSKTDLQRFDPSSFVPAVNTIPGVKMDERSPGSYRISIRGNLLRSTFGVRNVKVYLNGLPYTDASGNTYFNQLAINTIDKLSIIKGPGGSMYGAGTGGVVLLDNDATLKTKQVQITGGSYGLFTAEGKYGFGKKISQSLSFTHQQSDGYRDHTAMRRDVAGYTLSAPVNKNNTITGNILYSNLFYETPGGLTAAQVMANPRQSRPATPVFRSAVAQQAAIYLSTIYASVSDELIIDKRFKNTTGGYFTYTDFKNPTIRNYEQKNEKGVGGRTIFQYSPGRYDVAFGAEYQYTFINTSVYNNNLGAKTTLQYHDKIPVYQLNVFLQGGVDLPLRTRLTAGISYNDFHYGFDRVSTPALKDEGNFEPQYIPRISLLKKIRSIGSVYLSFSKGYSPPTIDEIHASNGLFNKDLSAERGTNYEGGIKLDLLKHRLFADVTYYIFHLQHTIVSRRDASGADFYVNAGKTDQQGVEFSLSFLPVNNETSFFRKVKLQTTGNYVHATFKDYQQGAAKYSGNKLTGTPPFVFSMLADATTKPGIYTNITYTYTDKIPVNDANTFFAKAYNLLFVKLGWQRKITAKTTLDIFGTMQRSFNKNYSLGNDLNADANRFFNPSASEVYSAGVALRW